MADPAKILARSLVSAHFDEVGSSEMARIVEAGRGDDFPEVEIALRAVHHSLERIRLLERALDVYGDEDFWGDDNCDAALAFHDRGRFARAVLAGQDILSHTAG